VLAQIERAPADDAGTRSAARNAAVALAASLGADTSLTREALALQ